MQQERSSSAAIALVWYYAPCRATARRPGVEMMSVILLQPVAISTERSTDWPCERDICNTARSFTHECNTCVIRRLAFLNLGFIDLLSCTAPCYPPQPRASIKEFWFVHEFQNLEIGLRNPKKKKRKNTRENEGLPHALSLFVCLFSCNKKENNHSHITSLPRSYMVHIMLHLLHNTYTINEPHTPLMN